MKDCIVCGEVTSGLMDKLCAFCKNKKAIHKAKILKVHSITNQAIKSGELERGLFCERCGQAWSGLEAHHDDYEKPLEVIWLCKTHHKEIHRGIVAFSSI